MKTYWENFRKINSRFLIFPQMKKCIFDALWCFLFIFDTYINCIPCHVLECMYVPFTGILKYHDAFSFSEHHTNLANHHWNLQS